MILCRLTQIYDWLYTIQLKNVKFISICNFIKIYTERIFLETRIIIIIDFKYKNGKIFPTYFRNLSETLIFEIDNFVFNRKNENSIMR